jgi:hypothetical protein
VCLLLGGVWRIASGAAGGPCALFIPHPVLPPLGKGRGWLAGFVVLVSRAALMETGEMVRTWQRDWGCVSPSEGPTGGRSSWEEGEQEGGRTFGIERLVGVKCHRHTLASLGRLRVLKRYALFIPPSCTFPLWGRDVVGWRGSWSWWEGGFDGGR